MALSLLQKKKAVANSYPGISWKHKVYYEMSDKQVVAIYNSLKKYGKLGKKKDEHYEYEQIMLEDWIKVNT